MNDEKTAAVPFIVYEGAAARHEHQIKNMTIALAAVCCVLGAILAKEAFF